MHKQFEHYLHRNNRQTLLSSSELLVYRHFFLKIVKYRVQIFMIYWKYSVSKM